MVDGFGIWVYDLRLQDEVIVWDFMIQVLQFIIYGSRVGGLWFGVQSF